MKGQTRMDHTEKERELLFLVSGWQSLANHAEVLAPALATHHKWQEMKRALQRLNDQSGVTAFIQAEAEKRAERIEALQRLQEELNEGIGIAWVECGPYRAVVKDQQGENEDMFSLTFQMERMPPFYTHDFKTLDEVLDELDKSTCPRPYAWTSIETEDDL
jgi:hypothetical protein